MKVSYGITSFRQKGMQQCIRMPDLVSRSVSRVDHGQMDSFLSTSLPFHLFYSFPSSLSTYFFYHVNKIGKEIRKQIKTCRKSLEERKKLNILLPVFVFATRHTSLTDLCGSINLKIAPRVLVFTSCSCGHLRRGMERVKSF